MDPDSSDDEFDGVDTTADAAVSSPAAWDPTADAALSSLAARGNRHMKYPIEHPFHMKAKKQKLSTYPATPAGKKFKFKDVRGAVTGKPWPGRFVEAQECFAGMTKKVICSNSQCKASKMQFVIVNRKFSGREGFSLNDELACHCMCPVCKIDGTVANIGFNNCRYQFKGAYTDKSTFESDFTAVGDEYYELTGKGDKEYLYVKIVVKTL
mmetsp:Transcript_16966/g.28288  ORF Transcript_16966/g.28288 Transcript_16966/m.28288 type:complete len:210 (+) Transcript_16966:93-722(+)